MKNKKVLSVLFITLLMMVSSFGMNNIVNAEKNSSIKDVETMTNKEKEKYYTEQTTRIDNSYKVGDALSKEDVMMLQNASEFKETQNKLLADNSWYFYGSDRSSKTNVEGQISGTITYTDNILHHNVDADGRVELLSGGATSARMRVHVISYGLIGSGGIGKTSDFWMSSRWTDNNYAVLDSSRSFTAAAVYLNIDAYGELHNSSGTLQIEDFTTLNVD